MAAERVIENIQTYFNCPIAGEVSDYSVFVQCPSCDIVREGRLYSRDQWRTYLEDRLRYSDTVVPCPLCRSDIQRAECKMTKLAVHYKDSLSTGVRLDWKDFRILQEQMAADAAKQVEAAEVARTVVELRQQLSEIADSTAQTVATEVAAAVAKATADAVEVNGRMLHRGLAFAGTSEMKQSMLAIPVEHVGVMMSFAESFHVVDRQVLKDTMDLKRKRENDQHKQEIDLRDTRDSERASKARVSERARIGHKNELSSAITLMSRANTADLRNAAMTLHNTHMPHC